MATTRFISMHQNKGKSIAACIADRTDYVKNPDKTNAGQYISSYECDPKTVQSEFLLAKRQYVHITGREQESNVIAYQIRQSFKPGEVTPELANKIGYELAMRFTKGKHAFIVATHIDKVHIHNHIIFNSTSLDCTKKFRDFLGSGKAVRRISDIICLENGLSIIENPQHGSKDYGKWLGDRKPVTYSDKIRYMIEQVLDMKLKDFASFLKAVEAQGYEVKRGKYIAVKGEGQKKFIRLRSLGEGYSEEEINAAISGAGSRIRHMRKDIRVKKSVNLLVDIQEKLQAGKGAGYERWAKVFNLKQMAATMNYLEENHITTLEELDQKVKEINCRYQESAEKIKKIEARMAEILEIQKQITNYAKTKEVYIAYQKAGYSAKFYKEHVKELLIHKAAKEAFTRMGVEKIPKMKELREKNRMLLGEKKILYGAYRREKEERKEIMVVKENVRRIMQGDAEREMERE